MHASRNADLGPSRYPVPSISRVSERYYRPELDGLRFFAFLAVYVNHTFTFGVEGQHRHLSNGFAHVLGTIGVAGAFGVDLFFALSAYLITELLLREREARGTLDVRAFYIRRILRIWPLYFFFLALAWSLTLFIPSERLDSKLMMGFFLLCGNWSYIIHPVTTVAAPLWSVSVEEQFYLLWPWAVRSGSVRKMVGIAISVLLVGLLVRLTLATHGINEPWVSKNSFTRIDGIAAGVLLAVTLRRRVPTLSNAARALLLSCSILVFLWVAKSFHLFTGPVSPIRIALGWPLVAAACSTILIAALGSGTFPGYALSWSPFVYLGRISYGLYVFHQIGLLVAERAFPLHHVNKAQWLAHFCLGLCCTVLLAAASYQWIERPFLKLKERFSLVKSRPPDGALQVGVNLARSVSVTLVADAERNV